MLRRLSLIAAAALLLLGCAAHPARLTVMTSGGFAAAYQTLGPAFAQTAGVKLTTLYGASRGGAPDSIPERLKRGEAADVIILARDSLDALTAQGLVVPESRRDLVLSRIGMAVRAGAPVPDISTPEAFVQVLRDAQSIGYSASASGHYLSTVLFPRLGLAEELAAKSRRILSERVAAVVARGEVEIGFQQISEILPIAGATLAGPIPQAYQKTTVFSAGILVRARHPGAAQRLIDFLSAPAAVPVIEAAGLDAAQSSAR